MMGLTLDWNTFRVLLKQMGPSLGLWRAAEIAVLRTQRFTHPIAEVGCGDGLVSSFVLDRIEYGFDPDVKALHRARPRGLYQHLQAVTVEQANVRAGSIATVVSNSVLEHVPRLGDALLAIRRLLRPGGRLIFTVPTEAMHRWLMLPVRRYTDWRNQSYAHWNLWPLAQWRNELAAAGFEIERACPYLRPGLVFAWDTLDMLQHPALNGKRLFPAFWKKLPQSWLDRLAVRAARLDLSAPEPGGGRMIVARRL